HEQRDIPLFNGGLDADKLQLLTQSLINLDKVNNCFICGPEDLTFMIRDGLVEAGLAKNRVHYELFVTGLSEEDKKKTAEAMEKRFDGTRVTVLEGGKELEFGMTEAYDNILDAA